MRNGCRHWYSYFGVRIDDIFSLTHRHYVLLGKMQRFLIAIPALNKLTNRIETIPRLIQINIANTSVVMKGELYIF